MKWLDDIPRVWKQAYLLICTWHFINFTISGIVEYKFFKPEAYVLWNTLFLFEALCISILLIFLWTYWLSRFQPMVQIAGHVAGIITFYFIMGTLSYYFDDYIEGLVYFEHWQEHMIELLSWDAIRFHDQYIITVGVFYIISYFQGLQKKDQEKSELALKNKEMQISLLKSQINPHFLFNTLNSISTLVHSSKEKARKVITQLSDIFRYALDSHNGEMVSLSQEIDFIENYILIQQVRFGERLHFVKEIDPTCLSLRIPPMILQPLVENSVKYGIAPKKDGGTINVSVRRAGGIVFFEVKDNGLGINAKNTMDASGSGVGMANTDLRLKSYFGPQSGLRVRATDRGYSVSFYIEDKKLQHENVSDNNKEIIEEQIQLN